MGVIKVRILLTVFWRVFAVEQFKIRCWKAIGQTNLVIKNQMTTARELAYDVSVSPNREEKPLVHCTVCTQ